MFLVHLVMHRHKNQRNSRGRTSITALSSGLPKIESAQASRFCNIWSPEILPVLRAIETRGIPVNLDKVQSRLAKLEAERQALEQQLRASPFAKGLSTAGTFTSRAGKQVFAENIIKKDTWPKSQKATGFSQGKKEVVAYRSNLQPDFADFYIDIYIPFAENLKTSRELQKALDSKTPGRYFGRFLTHGTATGRLSCKDNNLQNVDRNMRDIFEVPENSEHCFITADYSQVELRIQGALSQDEAILDVYRAGRDLHAETAAALVGLSVEQFVALKGTDSALFADSRTKAKAVNFGAAFGMSAKGLVDVAATQYGTELTQQQAQAFFAQHKQKYPTFYAWGALQAERAKREGYILTPGGRKRFVDKNAKNLARLAVNTPIQGGCAAALKLAMVKLGKEFPIIFR